jgi:cytochrome c-type biogenesis protein CcmH
MAGDTDSEVLDYLVERYGEFVLLKPRFWGANAMLWLAGPLAFLAGLAVIIAHLRRRKPRAATKEAPLTPEEQAALEKILDE